MLNGTSVLNTVQIIRDDHHCPIINEKTVHLMRLKAMAAASCITPPVLTGIVQIDDMFVRESQKASRKLENAVKYLGIAGHTAHNAMSDAMVLLDIWRTITE